MTLLYASLIGLLLVFLSARVIVLRRRFRVGLGTGQHLELERAIRAHANLIEYAPLALILMFLMEHAGAPGWEIHTLGTILVVSRCLHAFGVSRESGRSPGRVLGMAGTLLVIVVASVLNLVHVLMR